MREGGGGRPTLLCNNNLQLTKIFIALNHKFVRLKKIMLNNNSNNSINQIFSFIVSNFSHVSIPRSSASSRVVWRESVCNNSFNWTSSKSAGRAERGASQSQSFHS